MKFLIDGTFFQLTCKHKFTISGIKAKYRSQRSRSPT